MALGAIAWITMPLVGGAIGYVTNRLAVKMIFRPIQPRRILGVRVQGLIGRRQEEIATSIGRVVGSHLVSHGDVVAALESLDLEQLVDGAVARGLEPKVAELRSLPLVGNFLTDERIADLRASFVRAMVNDKHSLFEQLERAVEQGLDVQDVVTRKVREFRVEQLETLILEVAARELRAIELFGAVLGAVVGLVQALLLHLLA
jgi:uncharacterized membrane protein YheB (UPF0754 family)